MVVRSSSHRRRSRSSTKSSERKRSIGSRTTSTSQQGGNDPKEGGYTTYSYAREAQGNSQEGSDPVEAEKEERTENETDSQISFVERYPHAPRSTYLSQPRTTRYGPRRSSYHLCSPRSIRFSPRSTQLAQSQKTSFSRPFPCRFFPRTQCFRFIVLRQLLLSTSSCKEERTKTHQFQPPSRTMHRDRFS